ncbi:lasso peptide biosynthesis B2 protein [Microbacterium lacticum]|mgnify:CR=1 FL=1|uniref:lasso peptide biosynthesis B2 protein n=1 Tax=Microbacterium lacticum TaxID=33885 RepID=UPI0024323138|nr:lasso peptide biosynthesis B2 protein [Microbacterium lacticum]
MRLRTVIALGPAGWMRVVRTGWVAMRVERSLRARPLDQTAARFGLRLSFGRPDEVTDDLEFSREESVALDLALRTLAVGPFNSTCLRRALVIGDILRDRSPLLRVGVAKTAGEVTAHAWVEIDGVALDPMADREYLMTHEPRGPVET